MNHPSSLEAIFFAALEQDTPQERAAYLDLACAGDPDLRRHVERMLAAQAEAGGFLEQPASGIAAVAGVPRASEGLGTVIGPYKLVQQIGEGGMGTVFLAEQQHPVRRQVALKVIRAGMDTRQVIARFEAERQALAMMDHGNIARVLEAGTTESGRPYFVMELVHGVPITKYCDDNRLTPRERLELFVPVCQAIQHAHQKGIIHRDIKPSNVMITLYDGKPVPKVIDFGVAKAADRRMTEHTLFTQFGTMVGTLEYMSPEQAEMSALGVDTRGDIYSLGVLLYELLTGSTPLSHERIRGAAYGEILRMIKEEDPQKPSTRLSDSGEALACISAQRKTEPAKLARLLRGELDWIVMKTLEKDRNRRYETAFAFAADVQRYLSDEAVQACPPSASYRFRKFGRRNKGPVLASAIVLLVLIGGIIGTTWGLVRAEAARRSEAKRAEGERQAKQEALAAALAEKRAKEIAQAREVAMTAALGFLETRVLSAARPEGQDGGLGQDVTLRRALEAALPFVGKSFTAQPLIEARMRTSLGVSFAYLGDAKIAAEQFQAAHTLYTRHRGPGHPDTLASMNSLANCYDALGRHADALKLHEETLAKQKAKLGPDHPETLNSMMNLAVSYLGHGRHADALKLNEDTLAKQKARLGPDHHRTLMSMNNLATSYITLGRNADALKLGEETRMLMKARLGPDHPDTLKSMNTLARSYAVLGRHADALKLREETLVLTKAKLGPDHPETLASMSLLALSYHELGRHADALKLNEETLAKQKARLGPDHPDTLKSMTNLATSYHEHGRNADALKLLEDALALKKAKLGPDHPDTFITMMNLANCFGALGRHTDALKLREETLALQKTRLGPDHPFTLTTMMNLAAGYDALGRHADALKLHEKTLARRKAKLSPDHPDTLLSMGNLADSLVKMDRGAEAVSIIDECVQRSAGKVVAPRLIPMVIDLRLRHFAKNKDAAACGATAEMWENLKRTDADSLYNAACFRAVTATIVKEGPNPSGADATRLAREHADRAMDWLKQAVSAGYTDTAHMAQDKDLDPLRGREDYQKLVAEMQHRIEKDKS